jgi:phospholipid N-methyltransferase
VTKNNESVDIKKSGRKAFARVDAFVQEQISRSREGFNELVKAGAGGRRALQKPFSYLGTFIGDAGVAAIHPSSKYLVARVVRAVEQGRPRVVVEFGAAEGVMTKKILKSLPQDGLLAAIERNAGFYDNLTRITDARLRTARGDVRDVKCILDEMGVGGADCFVSGIPFSFLSPAERSSLVHEVYSRLPHGGRFVAYQCTTHLIPLLRKQFRQVKVELEIRNMPPHFVFTAIKK